jgi:hypothetical protein
MLVVMLFHALTSSAIEINRHIGHLLKDAQKLTQKGQSYGRQWVLLGMLGT